MCFWYCFSLCPLKCKRHEENLRPNSYCSLKADTSKLAKVLFFSYKFIHFRKGIKIYLWVMWNVSSAFLWWKNDLSQRVCKTSLVDQTICYHYLSQRKCVASVHTRLPYQLLLRRTQNIFSTDSVIRDIWSVILCSSCD